MNWKNKLFWDVIGLIAIGGMFTSPFLAARSWYVEAKRRFSLEAPRWRSVLALIALVFASGSVVLMMACVGIGTSRGGFPFYDPLLMWFYRYGFLSAAASLPFAFLGKGRSRWLSLGIGLLMSCYWFISAVTE